MHSENENCKCSFRVNNRHNVFLWRRTNGARYNSFNLSDMAKDEKVAINAS